MLIHSFVHSVSQSVSQIDSQTVGPSVKQSDRASVRQSFGQSVKQSDCPSIRQLVSRQSDKQKKQVGPLLYLILYGFVSFLDLFLQSVDVFLQRLDHSLQFVVLVLLPLYFSFVIVNLLLQACKLTRQKSSKPLFRLHFKHLVNCSVLFQQLSTGQLLKHP